MKPTRRTTAGFTLIEVMMAMAIMTIAFAAILSTQSSSILLGIKIRDLNIGGMLAHNLMVESEHLMEGKPFGELKDTEAGVYPQPYERFKWKRQVKEVKFPDFGIFSGGKDESGQQQGQDDKSRLLGQAVTKFLSEAVRELIVTVSWSRGDGELNVTLTTYLVNLGATFNFSI
jgi:general secretion pathway protein I